MNYNVIDIQTNLLTVVGFEQPQDPQFETLSTNLTTASSGIKINDGYIPYITLQNIKDLGINFDNFIFSEYLSTITYAVGDRLKYVYPTWLIGTTYNLGQRVTLTGISYESLINSNTGNSPTTDRTKWKALNNSYAIYDAILKEITTTSGVLVNGKTYRIDDVLLTDDFTNIGFVSEGVEFTATGTTPTTWTNSTVVYNITDALHLNKQPDINSTYWTEVNLFNEFLENSLKSSISNVVNKCVENQNKILEQKEIYFSNEGDGSATITNDTKICGLKFDFIRNANIKLKINRIGLHFTGAVSNLRFYVYNQNTQIFSFLASSVSNDFIWVDVSNIELTTDYKGSWFLYYSRNGLTQEAVNNQVIIPDNLSNFVKINSFECAAGTDLKTIDDSDYFPNTSFIANLDFSILPDLTNWITYNSYIFAEAIRLQFSLDMYKLFITNANVRSNISERNVDLSLLKGDIYTTDNETVSKKLNEAITNLRMSIGKAKIDNINLPTRGNMYNFYYNV